MFIHVTLEQGGREPALLFKMKTILNIQIPLLLKGLVVLVLIFVPFSTPEVCFGQEFLVPSLGIGESWEVKVEYKKIGPSGQWTAPVIFEYRVVGQENGNRYILVSQRHQQIGRIFFDSQFRIGAVEILKKMRGKREWVVLHPDQSGPVRGTGSIFPYDWPVFPLCVGKTVPFTKLIALSDNLVARRTVTQETECVSPGEVPSVAGVLRGKNHVYKVECKTETGQRIFVQYWGEGSSWPLYGENPDMRYWLGKE